MKLNLIEREHQEKHLNIGMTVEMWGFVHVLLLLLVGIAIYTIFFIEWV